MTESILYREMMIGEVRDADDKDRSFSHPISDEQVDAHGSIIKVEGWDLKRFKANPVVLFAHDSFGLPIGRSMRVWKEDGRLMTRTQFAGMDQQHPFAETAYKLVRDGFLRAWSVGFMPKERHRREDLTADDHFLDPYVYTKQELMEYSLVPVPSNPRALLEAKAAGHDVDPVVAWFGQHKQIANYYESRGILLSTPGTEDDDEDIIEVYQMLLEAIHQEADRR